MLTRTPEGVLALMARLHDAGHEAYVVGGSLRDCLIGRPPHDWDVATSALPTETLAVFADYRVIETGLRHGTVTVLADDGQPVEITTYRIDGDYLDARRPVAVSFTRSLDEDLARRDFTVCAMAWSPYDDRAGGIVDLFDGRGDLRRRLIRCVGDPATRFGEDALRILRAYRFSSELAFTVDEATRAGARLCTPLLDRISVERIASELRRTLLGEHAAAAVTAMAEDGVLARIFPLADPSAARILPTLPCELPVRLAALLGRCETGEAVAAARRLRYPNALLSALEAILSLRDFDLSGDDETAARRLLAAGGETAARDVLALRAADGEDVAAVVEALARVLDRGDCVRIADLALRGADLTALGLRGPAIGATLSRLLDAVLADPRLNERDALLALVRQG